MTQRLIWLDVLRGILLLLICIGHFNDYPSFVKLIIKPTSMFYVPMFYIISGYLFNSSNSFKNYFSRKNRSLLIPYLFFSALFILLDWNTYLYPLSAVEENLYRCFLEGKGVVKSSPLWFVIVLYFSSLMVFVILKLFANRYVIMIIIAFLSMIAYIFSIKGIELPLLFHLVPSAVVFMIVGSMMKKMDLLFSVKGKISLMIISIGIGLVGMFINLGDMHFNQIDNYPMFFICPIFFTFGIIQAFKLADSFIERNRFLKIFVWISQNGIVILSCHCWLVFAFSAVAVKIPFLHDHIWILFISKFIFVMLGLYLFFVPIMNKYFYKFLGKKHFLSYKECLML